MTLPTAKWRTLINEVAADHPPLPADVFEAMVLVESNGDPTSKSASNAIGLAQIIYRWHNALVDKIAATLQKLGGEQALFDPEVNLRVGASHLVWCFTSSGSTSWEMAVTKYFTGSANPPPDFVDGQGTSPNQHITKLRAALKLVRVDRAIPQETPMPTKQYTTTVPGLPFGPIVTEYPVSIYLIPASHTRQRPGIKARLPRRSVQHGTGNPNSMAAGEMSWLVDQQADGAQVSFHCCSDHLGVHVGVPYDEVTYQAADGAGPGNMNGASHEGIENSAMWADPVKRARAIFVMADWQGRISARLDIANPEQHWTFNYNQPPSKRHDCPNKLRHIAGAWTTYVTQWSASYADEFKRLGGIVTPPIGQGLALGDTVRPTERVNIRQAPGTGNAVLLVLTPDQTATISANPVTADGYTWYGVRGAFGAGWVTGNWLEEVAPPAKPIDPAPIKALLGTDLKKNDTATGIVSDDNGTDFIFVADVIEVTTKDGLDIFQYADRATKLKHYDQGHRFIGAWLCKYSSEDAGEEDWFYIEPEPLWGRVPYEGTKRIADAPLLPAEDSNQEAA